ncbi:hypothetical protein CFC21_094685 [Triticum aestivum]|uniref:Dynamin-type G domain-containing protein n=2 Tax=Triticum aestivum TaxID=4565 RepID=A0A3B6QPE1_WHEAT|nr:phragmoplastin DRP1B-like [Triticum aestivum]KAF7092179.1 hypothetical protein CFC21_094685 [Triticum aestivum]
MEDLIYFVNKLQLVRSILADDGVGSALPIDSDEVPYIAVVGGQGVGKSSLIEAIVGKDFLPKGIATRRPLVVQLFRTEEAVEYARFSHQPERRFEDFAEVAQEIADETDRETQSPFGVSSIPIHLSIFSPSVINLTLVDLPGLVTKIADDHRSDNTVQEIQNMVGAFIGKPNCIILAVSPANQDLSISVAVNTSQEIDPNGKRTFDVLTKVDLMENRATVVNILEGRFCPSRFPWVGVVNRSQEDININLDIIAARRRERDYFGRIPEYKHLAHRMGSEHLVRSLAKYLESYVKTRIGGYLLSNNFIKSAVTKKNRLQGYSLRAYGTFPSYHLCTEGEQNEMTFQCTVDVHGQKFASAMHHRHLKDAEEDAADVAYTSLMGNETMETLFELLNKDTMCKVTLLLGYVHKKKVPDPVYASSRVSVEPHRTFWLSTVTLDDNTYIGEFANTRRKSIQNAAFSAVSSMLESGNDLMIECLISKRMRTEVPRRKRCRNA